MKRLCSYDADGRTLLYGSYRVARLGGRTSPSKVGSAPTVPARPGFVLVKHYRRSLNKPNLDTWLTWSQSRASGATTFNYNRQGSKPFGHFTPIGVLRDPLLQCDDNM